MFLVKKRLEAVVVLSAVQGLIELHGTRNQLTVVPNGIEADQTVHSFDCIYESD